MTSTDFDRIVTNRLSRCQNVLCAKGEEYARNGDRLWNFKVAGRMQGKHPAQALDGMRVKHEVSVADLIDGLARGIVPDRSTVAEKIGDSINYLLLLEGLIEEARATHERLAAASFSATAPLFPQDGDDDPAVVQVDLVSDRTSRSTMPEQCLGNPCGRFVGR